MISNERSSRVKIGPERPMAAILLVVGFGWWLAVSVATAAAPGNRLRVAPGTLSNALRLAWKFKTGGPVVSSAAFAGGRAFIGSGDKNIYAINLRTGTKAWAFKTGDSVEASPIVVNGLVIVGAADGILYALDANTGQPKWKYKTEDKILGAANAVPAPNGKGTWIVIGSYDYKVHCVDAANGKMVWTYETENYVNGSPAVSNGKVVFGGCDGNLHVVNLATGKRIRAVEIGDYIAGSAALDGRFAYLGHYGNAVVCADIDAGKVVWAFRDRKWPYFSSPAVTADRVFIGGRDKRLHCLNRATGRQIWDFPTRGKVDSSPMVCGDKVVFGSEDGRLYMVGLAGVADGKQRWSYTIGAPVMGSPSISDGMVIIGADDGYVYAFAPK